VTLYCQTGHTSSIAGNALVSDGYCNVRYLEGGIQAWQSAGYPVNP
jgi:rhodanese-related sulfurtransferase